MSTYEPCVLGSDGNCTRWSHDHAADRPSVTDNARAAEVLAAHQRQSIGMTASSPDHCSCGEVVPPEPDLTTSGPAPTIEGRRYRAFAAHQAAALAAGRAETTTATTEDAARVMRDEWMQHGPEVTWLHMARTLDARGLLATARTLPTRDDLARAIASGYETDHPAPNRHDYRAADAVLALLRDGALTPTPTTTKEDNR